MIKFVPYVLIMLTQGESVLLLRRGNVSFGAGQYCMVGGKVDGGETARQAAAREALEEIGVVVEIDDLQLVHTFHRKGPSEELFALVFKAEKWSGEPVNKEPEKHDSVGWFSCLELPSDILAAHRQAIEHICSGSAYSEHNWG